MFKIIKKEIEWGGRKLTLETGRIARQASGAVLATYGDTSVLCTVVGDKKPKEGVDFFPLTVNYQEKTFAAGKIPGGFFKREGRPTEKEILTSRLIDRPIRPLFDEKFRNETQIVCTVVSHDGVNDPDIVAMVGTSAAIAISGIPFDGPIGAARVGYIDGQFILNPEIQVIPESELDLVVAGTKSSVLMVESLVKELSEETMLKAVMFGHQQMQMVIDAISDMAGEVGNARWDIAAKEVDPEFLAKLKMLAANQLGEAYKEQGKQLRREKIDAVKLEATKKLVEEGFDEKLISSQLKKIEMEIVRGAILNTGIRIDGRSVEKIRPIDVQVGILPRTHGSALFTRGETQSIVVTTLGTGDDEQIIDSLEGEYRERFLLHYNFPPYSVGEATPLRPPGRREVGHGKLAWRALYSQIPDKNEFPYTIRVVSEITESNGSSSMATVCGASLSMMEAGVPLKNAVAGIAMGLIKEGDKFSVLSDIMGDEDHLGDMDFKVAGTKNGITSLQMDMKINGITEEIMGIALRQAKDGRMHILEKMNAVITSASGELNSSAPRVISLTIPTEKIREVIGTGGKVIREICDQTNAKIDIEDDGSVRIYAVSQSDAEAAFARVQDIVAEAEMDKIYTGKVVRITDFGAFVNIFGNKDGLLHISELADHRVNRVTDVVNEGDTVKVKVIGMDDKGKIKLSYRAVNQETGEDISHTLAPKQDSRPPRQEGGRESRGDGGRRGEYRERGDRDRGGDRGDRGNGRGDRDRDNRGPRGDGRRQDRPERGPRERDFDNSFTPRKIEEPEEIDFEYDYDVAPDFRMENRQPPRERDERPRRGGGDYQDYDRGNDRDRDRGGDRPGYRKKRFNWGE